MADEKTRLDELIDDEKTRVLDYDPKDRAAYIRHHVDLIKDAKAKHMSKSLIQQRFPDFADKYPTLFKALFTPDMDMRQIDYMIRMLGTIGTGGKTLHDASKAVGAQLADRYINSVVDTRKKKD